jgi:hypothetical protein
MNERKPVLNVLIDRANWQGIVLRSMPTLIEESMVEFVYKNEIYFTRGELFVAQMLDLQRLTFTPHVLIEFHEPDREIPAKLPRKLKKKLARQSKRERAAALKGLKPRLKRGQYRRYEPDFVLGSWDCHEHRAFIWTNPDGTQEVVHGIECKETMPEEDNCRLRKVGALEQSRGINIKVLTEAEIFSYALQGFQLPLRPLPSVR